jgi:hypothetical protein
VQPTDIREHLEVKPFIPFRLFMSDGATYGVLHPDMCILARSTFYVGIPDPRERGVAQRVAHCSLLHITRVEPINGHARRKRGGKSHK